MLLIINRLLPPTLLQQICIAISGVKLALQKKPIRVTKEIIAIQYLRSLS